MASSLFVFSMLLSQSFSVLLGRNVCRDNHSIMSPFIVFLFNIMATDKSMFTGVPATLILLLKKMNRGPLFTLGKRL